MDELRTLRINMIEKIKDKFPKHNFKRCYITTYANIDCDYRLQLPDLKTKLLQFDGSTIEFTFCSEFLVLEHLRYNHLFDKYAGDGHCWGFSTIHQRFEYANPNFAMWKIYKEIRTTIKLQEKYQKLWGTNGTG